MQSKGKLLKFVSKVERAAQLDKPTDPSVETLMKALREQFDTDAIEAIKRELEEDGNEV